MRDIAKQTQNMRQRKQDYKPLGGFKLNKETVAMFILGSSEVQEVLMINRRRLNALVKTGKLTPFKELKRENLFWLPDVDRLKAEMMADSRTNLHKQSKLPVH